MIILDTTVLLYAVGVEHRFRKPCRTLVNAVAAGDLAATTTAEVIQEFTHVRAKRRDRADSADLADAYLDLLSPLLVIEETHARAGLRLFASAHDLGSFDAVLAAAARATGATVVSADAAFASGGAAHVIPDDDGVRTLLASGRGGPG